MFDTYQRWTNSFDFSELDRAREQLEARHAMDDTARARGGGIAVFRGADARAAGDR